MRSNVLMKVRWGDPAVARFVATCCDMSRPSHIQRCFIEILKVLAVIFTVRSDGRKSAPAIGLPQARELRRFSSSFGRFPPDRFEERERSPTAVCVGDSQSPQRHRVRDVAVHGADRPRLANPNFFRRSVPMIRIFAAAL